VQQYRWQSLTMGSENAIDECQVSDGRGAFVMNYHIKILGPVGRLIDGIKMSGRFIWIEGNLDIDMSSGGNTLLRLIVVTATTQDQKNAQWCGGRFGGRQ
jgi:hypothetical protein